MMALWISLALSFGVFLGYALCAAMVVARDEQRAEQQRGVPRAVSPLETDSTL